jgi:hypothetical protein
MEKGNRLAVAQMSEDAWSIDPLWTPPTLCPRSILSPSSVETVPTLIIL